MEIGGTNPPAKLRVLLVDDEPHVRIVLKEILASLNCEVVAEATTGLEAVTLYREQRPELMILDITMPILSGEEVLMMIMTEYPDAVVIILTSMTDEQTVNACLDLGAYNFIRKDTPLDEIKTIIRETLDLCYGKEE
jgi:two-component system, chemotaxis family, chemotaxis protein CheY